MKPIYKNTLIILLFPFIISTAISQDIIVKIDGEKIKAEIVEINSTRIKYYNFRDVNNLVFTIDRALVKEIKFESGNRYKEERPGSSDLYYQEDKIHNVKINFLALNYGDLIFSFERAIDSGSSLEATMKIMGVWESDNWYEDDRAGFGLNVGYKLKLGDLFKKSYEYRPKHLLQGSYFRPVLGYTWSQYVYSIYESEVHSYGHFGLDFGHQLILRNAVSLDLFAGFHFYGGSFKNRDSGGDTPLRDKYLEDGDFIGDHNRALAFGLRVGGLFTKQGARKNKMKKVRVGGN